MVREQYQDQELISSNSGGDGVLFYTILILLSMGIVSLFSVSYPRSEVLYDNAFAMIVRQALWVFVGIIGALVLYSFNLEKLRKSSPFLVFVSIGLLLLPFVPGISTEYLGARRWIFLFNVSIQPSEFVRLSLVLYLSHILANKEDKMHDLVNTILPSACVVTAIITIIYLQNDFSTAAFIFSISLLMFFAAGVRMRHFLMLFSVFSPLMAILLFTREHRVERLISFLVPDYDPAGSGFQILSARNALAEGGLWGRGIGMSVNKQGIVPEVHSDFALAIIGEELGYLGICVVLGLFAIFALRGYAIVYKSEQQFVRLCAFGLTSIIFLQALINASVVIGILPTTGMTLPFFSAGGSSLIVTLAMSGVLLSLSRGRSA